MSEAKHTPGPWHYDGLVQIVEAARPHMRVAFLPSDHDEYASSKPNGRLIAAAPDLLAALAAVLKWYGGAADDDSEWSPCMLQARTAIAKAEGKP